MLRLITDADVLFERKNNWKRHMSFSEELAKRIIRLASISPATRNIDRARNFLINKLKRRLWQHEGFHPRQGRLPIRRRGSMLYGTHEGGNQHLQVISSPLTWQIIYCCMLCFHLFKKSTGEITHIPIAKRLDQGLCIRFPFFFFLTLILYFGWHPLPNSTTCSFKRVIVIG